MLQPREAALCRFFLIRDKYIGDPFWTSFNYREIFRQLSSAEYSVVFDGPVALGGMRPSFGGPSCHSTCAEATMMCAFALDNSGKS